MKITLKDGSIREYDGPRRVIDIAGEISEGLARAACAGEIDGEVCDLRTEVKEDCSLNILTAREEGGLATPVSYTHLDVYKRQIPFCTSGGSGIGESGRHLAEQAGSGNWLTGQRFSGNVSEEELRSWIDGL